MSTAPQVFLSSTAYDLRQVRADIGSFVDALGYGIVDSTDPRFYASPSIHAYDACLREVSRSDLLILIIGGRYGSEAKEMGRSITNLEWETAFRRQIPIFTFVDRTVWDLKRMWELDRSRGFEPHVEDNRVFDFIEQVNASVRNNWIWPFTAARDITDVLRSQWATMFAEALRESVEADTVRIRPDRRHLMSEYLRLFREARAEIDLLGVSLATVARASGVERAVSDALNRGVKLRVLTLDSQSPAAQLRGSEEYGTDNLLAELDSTRALWGRFLSRHVGGELRLYAARPSQFLFRTDDSMYVSHYFPADSGANAPTIAFSRDSAPSRFYRERFELLWGEATRVA